MRSSTRCSARFSTSVIAWSRLASGEQVLDQQPLRRGPEPAATVLGEE
jgi:hypothetical protein